MPPASPTCYSRTGLAITYFNEPQRQGSAAGGFPSVGDCRAKYTKKEEKKIGNLVAVRE